MTFSYSSSLINFAILICLIEFSGLWLADLFTETLLAEEDGGKRLL